MGRIGTHLKKTKEDFIKYKKFLLLLLIILSLLLVITIIWGKSLANNDGLTLRNEVISASEEGDYKKIQEIFYTENRTLTKEEAKAFIKYTEGYTEPDLKEMATFLNENEKVQYVDGETFNKDNSKAFVRLHRGNKFLGFWQGYRAELLTTNFEEEDTQEDSKEIESTDMYDEEDVPKTPDADAQRMRGGGTGY